MSTDLTNAAGAFDYSTLSPEVAEALRNLTKIEDCTFWELWNAEMDELAARRAVQFDRAVSARTEARA
jgi:hypothetical protein